MKMCRRCFIIWDREIERSLQTIPYSLLHTKTISLTLCKTNKLCWSFLMKANGEKIVLFDGVCNYCNAMINLAIRNDKKGVLKFATLQSETGKQIKSKYDIPSEIESVIFIENGEVYAYSDAAIRIARHLRWPAKALFGFIIIPKFIRQPIYRWIARNRYKWFGKREECMIPTPELKERFLN